MFRSYRYNQTNNRQTTHFDRNLPQRCSLLLRSRFIRRDDYIPCLRLWLKMIYDFNTLDRYIFVDKTTHKTNPSNCFETPSEANVACLCSKIP